MQRNPSNNQDPITVMLADDQPIIRAGIRAILDEAPDINVIGEAETKDQAQQMVEKFRPKMLLLEPALQGVSLVQWGSWVQTIIPETITLILTTYDHDACLAKMMDAGASGFLSKTETGERLISAIRRAASGTSLFTEEQFERALRWKQAAGGKWQTLTDREREIIRLAAEGYDNKELAQKLNITPKTIAFHITNILKKLEAKSRHEAIAWVNKYLPDNLE